MINKQLIEEHKNLELICKQYKVKLLGKWETESKNKEIMIDYPPTDSSEFEAKIRKAVSNVIGIIYQKHSYHPPSSDINYIF